MFAAAGWSFASAGLRATPGQMPTEPAAELAALEGLDLSAHRSRRLDHELLAKAAWLLAMTRGQAAQLRVLAEREDEATGGLKIGVLGAPGVDLRLVRHSPACEEVADPWGGDEDVYRATSLHIRRLLERWSPVLSAGPDPEGT